MIDTGGIRKGLTIEIEGHLYKVLESQHIKIGRGSAQVRMRLRDLRGGHTIDRTVQAGEKFAIARLERRTAQYLYRDGELLYFMDTENFEQTPLSTESLQDVLHYITEGSLVDIIVHKDQPIDIELPTSVELKVTATDPGFRGDTAQGATKPATLETGLILNIPLFVNEGDMIKVDTRTGDYMERV